MLSCVESDWQFNIDDDMVLPFRKLYVVSAHTGWSEFPELLPVSCYRPLLSTGNL